MRYKLLQCSGVEPSSVPTARYDGMHEVRALVNNAYACKHRNALYRIVAVLHAWGRCTHKRACMLRIPEHTYANARQNRQEHHGFFIV